MKASFIAVALVVSAQVILSACGGAPAVPARTVSFRMKGQPPQATVTIDDQPIGPLEMVQKRGIALPAGPHRITVEAPGYLPMDRIVNADDKPIVLDVALVPIPE